MKSIIYYTDNRLSGPIYDIAQKQLSNARLPVISASLESIHFGDNVVISGERSYPTMVRQIISCLERSKSKYVFFCEHDVLYHPSHFEFTPERDDIFYYNANSWRWLVGSETLIRHDRMLSLSSLCANREFVLDHHKRRLKFIEENELEKEGGKEPRWARKMGYEPGTKKKKRGGFSDDDFEKWSSEFPIIDIRHGKTFSSPKINLMDFIHKPKWWEEISAGSVPGWDLWRLFYERT